MQICPKCEKTHYNKGRFCSRSCANSRGPRTDEFKKTVSEKLSKPKEAICSGCGIIFIRNVSRLNRSKNHYCSASCSPGGKNKKSIKTKTCKFCSSVFNSSHSFQMFCSNVCSNKFKNKERLDTWLSGNMMFDENICEKIPTFIRKYLIEKAGFKCEECGWGRINLKTGKVPLTINHKNGNPIDHRRENLEVICPNCHSLTSTYCGLNKGNGRKKRNKKLKFGNEMI